MVADWAATRAGRSQKRLINFIFSEQKEEIEDLLGVAVRVAKTIEIEMHIYMSEVLPAAILD